ncbi:MAG: DNA polymerase I [Candidatus Amulumruptor caecigallinarius]|nr:DNA polymerase I [Candidatus Amulumruptor caecigallinarius]
MDEKRLFLLDAYALIFRAYYALIKVPRITRSGFNTSAIFGFVNTLEEVLRKEHPSHLAVCFDPQGPTFRSEQFEAYKAERASTPEDIKLSVPIIKEIIKAYNIPVVEVAGYEADDVIGTLAKIAEKEGFTTYMMTPDKDFGQLVSADTLQYKPAYKGKDFEIRGVEEVCARYGLTSPIQVIDLLALMGDKIDNIPGCPGVGEKTAVKLISQFGSVEQLLMNTDQLKGALKQKVEENAEQIRFSKYLATICTDVPVGINPEDLVIHAPDCDKLFAIFKELEFKTLADRVRKRLNDSDRDDLNSDSTLQHSDFDLKSCAYTYIDDLEALQKMKFAIERASKCSLITISDGENDISSHWVGTSVSVKSGEAWFVPGSFNGGNAYILDIMARSDIEKISIDSKRDYVTAAMARTDNAIPLSNYYDITLAHYLLQPEMRHGIEELASTYLGLEINLATIIPTLPTKAVSYQNMDKQTLLVSACLRADMALRLRDILDNELRKKSLYKLFEEIELPLVKVLAKMEIEGVGIDTAALQETEKDMEKRLLEIENEIFNLAEENFNVASPAKVGEILFDKLSLEPKGKKTKTGQYSTSEDVLEKLVNKHPIVRKILEFRSLKKLLSTYITALPAAINPATGRIHTNYNQTVTATGRISSSSPNLQNIPVRDNEGKEIRRAFIADKGCVFLSADYSQIELRLMADFSHDEIMLDAFMHGKDIHAITAARIYHKNVEEVTPNERRNAKTANFGIIYGISPFGLSTRLGISRQEAKDIIDNYFLTFPTVKKYMSDSVEFAREHGYVQTKMGRKRILPDINSKNPVVRGYAERNAINAPLQGTAADIIKLAMIRISDEMEERNLRSRMIMQVHDELNFNVPEDEIGIMQEIVERQMENAYTGEVRLTASSGVAANWLDAH